MKGLDDTNKATQRETWILGRTSGTSGTTAVGTFDSINGVPIDLFDELLVYMDVTQALSGSSPTMDIYLQRAVVPNPDPTNDNHWDDLAAFPQITTSTAQYILPMPATFISGSATANNVPLARFEASLSSGALRVGHWGNYIRIVEKMGGTVTQAAVYSIHVTGIRRQ